ncbi:MULTISPECIES: hypothetical protein [unclassified Streptomyces]|uniref:hypothetical protein n=1 Tax=unclassified Streptomyces TaxID=2593676 RepID=UPI00093BA6E6|nr:hypothetical protein [Streptomyces sp. TSRI0281]OKI44807.1 hypothetical protein A6A29_34330 [Streptomyces sp. TSRI0281]
MSPAIATGAAPPPLAATDMALRLTTPFARGADHLDLVVRGRTIELYDFKVHSAVFGHTPDPLYVLQARKDVLPGTTVTFTLRENPGGTVEVTLPDGLLAGTTAALPRSTGLLSGIKSSGPPGPEEERWRLTALLGTMGKLLWIVGWERDHLRAQLGRTVAVRSPRAEEVRGRVLDLHGAGLGVVRSSGESDTAYRRRVELARRWTLPTPAGFAAALNAAVGPIGNTAEPLLVDDANGPLRRGLLRLRVVPATLLPGQWIDPLGRTGTGPAVPLSEGYFDPYYLTALAPAVVDIAPPPPGPYPPGQPPPAPGRVQPAVEAALRRLAGLLTGRVRVTSGFDPGAADARATGRAVLLTHPTTGAGRLAALAHRAGFDVVTHRPDGQVYAECVPGELLVMNTGPGVVTEGQQLTLGVTPAPPSGATVRWRTVHCGPGRGTFTAPAEGPTASLTGQAAGRVVVTAELRDGPHTLTVSREITVLPGPLANGTAIGADGTRAPADPVVGVPVDPVFLARHDDPAHVDYGTDPNHHRMRREAARLLDALVGLLRDGGVTGKLVVQAAFEPTGTPLARAGQELRLTHPGLTPGALAVGAHRAGFTHVSVSGAVVTVRQAIGDHPVEVGAVGLTDGVLEVGAVAKLTVSPTESQVGVLGVLVWSTGDGAASLLTTAPAEMSVRGDHPGPAWVQASYRPATGPGAYQMTVRPHPDLAGHVLTPAERDLITHLLAELRPLGVEVVTKELTGGSP